MSDAITRLRAALEAGPTPGPWYVKNLYFGGPCVWAGTDAEPTGYEAIAQFNQLYGGVPNAAFIAAADPTTMAALLDRLDRAEAVVEAARAVQRNIYMSFPVLDADRLMALWQEPWSEPAFGEAQMLLACLRALPLASETTDAIALGREAREAFRAEAIRRVEALEVYTPSCGDTDLGGDTVQDAVLAILRDLTVSGHGR